jgi:hypothetical protein
VESESKSCDSEDLASDMQISDEKDCKSIVLGIITILGALKRRDELKIGETLNLTSHEKDEGDIGTNEEETDEKTDEEDRDGVNLKQPALEYNKEVVEQLRMEGFSLKYIGEYFGKSHSTLKRFCKKNDIKKCTVISQEELEQKIRQQLLQHDANTGNVLKLPTKCLRPCLQCILMVFIGWKMMKGYLEVEGIRVGQRRIVEGLNKMDDVEGRLPKEIRIGNKIRRRKYTSEGSNDVWHIDGHEKLMPWGFYIHGAVDGYSEFVVWMFLTTTKKSSKIFEIYQQAVTQYGRSNTIRSDKGGETVLIAFAHILADKKYTTGRSVHNSKIERIWVEVQRNVGLKYKERFVKMENEGLLDRRDNFQR